MAVAEAHPSVEELAAFTLGILGDETQASIEVHVAVCTSCQERAAVASGDTLVELLRSAHARTSRGADTVVFTAAPGQTPLPLADLALTEALAPAAADPSDIPDVLPLELVRHERYRVVRLVGAGGMGAVYEAEHRVMRRPVALKVIKRALTVSAAALERFRREVRAAARLSHPNIVTTYDAEDAGETHFLVMEYVEGIDLGRLVQEHGPLPVDHACDYIRQAALGLQHAFEQGMVHRDLKPHNLMLTPSPQPLSPEAGERGVEKPRAPEAWQRGFPLPAPPEAGQRGFPLPSPPEGGRGVGGEGGGRVKILDFGLARFASETADAAGLTSMGVVLGTVDYIAPEQADNARQADIRSDIYSLGCTLYHLLAGQPPFPTGTALQKVMAHMEKKPQPLTELRDDLPEGLMPVLERLMAKDPRQRYQTPAEVAFALEPFLRATAVARAPRRPARTTDPSRTVVLDRIPGGERRRPRLARAVAILALFVAGLLGMGVYRIATDNGVLEIRTDNDDVEVVVSKGGEVVKIIDTKSGKHVTLNSGEYELALKDGGDLKILPSKITLKRGKTELATITREENPGRDALASATKPAAKENRLYLSDLEKTDWEGLGFANNGGGTGIPIAVNGIKFSKGLWTHPQAKGCCWVKYRLSGLGATTFVTKVAINDSALATLPTLLTFQVLGDGKALWTSVPTGERGQMQECRISVKDVSVLELRVDCPGWNGWAHAVWLDPYLLLSSPRNTEKVGEIRHFEGHKGSVRAVAYSPCGRYALSASGWPKGDGTLRLWDVRTGTEVWCKQGECREYISVAFSPDGKRAMSGNLWGDLRLWEVETGKELRAWKHEPKGVDQAVYGLAFLPDGKHVLSGGGTGLLRLWDVETGTEVKSIHVSDKSIWSIAVSPDGGRVIASCAGNLTRLWDLKTSRELRHFEAPIGVVAYSPCGKYILTDQSGNKIQLWDAATGKEIRQFIGHTREIASLAFSPDSQRALSGSWDGTIRLWDVATGKELHRFEKFQGWVATPRNGDCSVVFAAFSPDGRYAFSGGIDGVGRLWRLPDPPMNLIKNAGFDAGFEGWVDWSHGPPLKYEFDRDVVREGRQSLRVTTAEPADCGCWQDVDVKPGQWYRFTGWVRTRGLKVHGASRRDSPLAWGTIVISRVPSGPLVRGDDHSGDTEWTRISLRFQAPDDGKARIVLSPAYFARITGTVWFDGLKLVKENP